MYLQTVKSKNAVSYYAAKTVYEGGKKTSHIVEKLGTEKELRERYDDVEGYLKRRIAELTAQEKEARQEVLIRLVQGEQIEGGRRASFNCGYLFLQKIYNELKIDRICREIASRHKFEYDLNAILSRLIYGRILFPRSKMGTMAEAHTLLEQPDFQLHDVYRSLDVLAKENAYIQSQLYKNSGSVVRRNDRILYYDCTNYYFEIEEESGLRQYGVSKEHRPNPIVEMGLFMDGDGVPLAFSIHPGHQSEQTTLQPLENEILQDFGHGQFVVCTDAGLASLANRKFNSVKGRRFITAQSLKKLKAFQREWALDPRGWRVLGSTESRKLSDAGEDTLYKERWFKEDGLEQRIIVTYSRKYREYMSHIRERQISRAQKKMDMGDVGKARANDPERFIGQQHTTNEGEIAEKVSYALDQDKIDAEAAFDGFYALATNLEETAEEILAVNARRWEIEESFRIMKSEFKARPVYLSRDDRITAHFITCYLALMIFRILEKRVGEGFTESQLLSTLRDMNLYRVGDGSYIPTYMRTEVTDALHDDAGFRTDYTIIPNSLICKILKVSRHP